MIAEKGFGFRTLGRKNTLVSPIGLAGSTMGVKNPTEDVYREGLKKGINLLLWDSSFKPMTNVLLELSDEERAKLFIGILIPFGGPERIRKWTKTKLEFLRLDRIPLLMLGWVRTRYRVRESVLDELMELREKGICDNIGLSIHKRALAFEISQKNVFDIFMVRYNAANRGLEKDFLDKIDSDNRPGVITYTTTRWGKLLKPPPKWEGDIPRPGDLYRFSLSHNKVDNVLMSPMNLNELESNLNVIEEGSLKPDESNFVERFGDAVYNSKSRLFGDNFEHSSRL